MGEGLITIAFMANELERKPDTVKRQLQAKGIKPSEYAGPTGMYPRSALEAIRYVAPVGRPPKTKTEPDKKVENAPK